MNLLRTQYQVSFDNGYILFYPFYESRRNKDLLNDLKTKLHLLDVSHLHFLLSFYFVTKKKTKRYHNRSL